MRISDWSSDVCSSDLGGGKELLVKLYNDIGGNVESFLSGPMPTQAFGWFKKPVTKTADLKGLKFRTNGDRKSVVSGKSVSVRVDLGGRSISKKKKETEYRNHST